MSPEANIPTPEQQNELDQEYTLDILGRADEIIDQAEEAEPIETLEAIQAMLGEVYQKANEGAIVDGAGNAKSAEQLRTVLDMYLDWTNSSEDVRTKESPLVLLDKDGNKLQNAIRELESDPYTVGPLLEALTRDRYERSKQTIEPSGGKFGRGVFPVAGKYGTAPQSISKEAGRFGQGVIRAETEGTDAEAFRKEAAQDIGREAVGSVVKISIDASGDISAEAGQDTEPDGSKFLEKQIDTLLEGVSDKDKIAMWKLATAINDTEKYDALNSISVGEKMKDTHSQYVKMFNALKEARVREGLL